MNLWAFFYDLLNSLSYTFNFCYFMSRVLPFQSLRSRHPFLICWGLTSFIEIPAYFFGSWYHDDFRIELLVMALMYGKDILALLFAFQAGFLKKLALYVIFAMISGGSDALSYPLVLLGDKFTGSANYFILYYVIRSLVLVVSGLLTFFLSCNVSKLVRRCIDYLNPWIVLQLTFPVIGPFLAFNFFYLSFSSSAAGYVFYIILCALTYVVFIRGAKKLRREQYKYTEKAEKLQLIQEQLNASSALSEGEKRFRKWNHDIKNHLLSLSCLMKTGNKQELNAYLEQILKTEADHEA